MMKQQDTKILERFANLRIGVLGDMMLDRYVFGRASRISQEAPVPVVHVQKRNSVPGGAANVARNLRGLRASSLVFGVVGKDADGEELISLLQKSGADTRHVLHLASRPTTVKTRILAGNQQIVRIDQEETSSLHGSIRRRLLQEIAKALHQGEMDGLILEDYAKGLFGRDFMQAVVNLANTHGIPVFLDPHPSNPFNIKGLRLMTPNRNEAFALAGVAYSSSGGVSPDRDKMLLNVAKRLDRRWNPQELLITLGADGIALFVRGSSQPFHIPTQARQVFDVSGAGDTVMATLVLALLAGANVQDAARIANFAAGEVVGQIGTAPIEIEALRNALSRT